jgi:V/A-type H+-transporting ATPase subunit A
MPKQYKMLKLIMEFNRLGQEALEAGAELSQITSLAVRERIGRAKYIPEEKIAELETIMTELITQMRALTTEEVL